LGTIAEVKIFFRVFLGEHEMGKFQQAIVTLTIAAFNQFSFAQAVQNIPVPASSTGGAQTASVLVPSLAQITTLATDLSNTAYSNSVSTSTNYTNAAIAGITCPAGQVRQGTTCIVPINATDVSTAAENARASAVLTSTNYATSVANTAYTNAVSVANTSATNYTNTAIANITCPAGQVRQGTTCVVPINSTDVWWVANYTADNAKAAANTYTNTAIANITCPAGQVRQGTSCVVPINANDVATSSANAVSNAVGQANTYTNNYIAYITCPAGQVRQGTSCVVPINANDVATAANNAQTNAINTSVTAAYTNTAAAINAITCPTGQVRQGTTCVVPVSSADVNAAYNSAYYGAIYNAQSYTNTAIANITCPAGQVRQGTTCVVPINSTDVWWVANYTADNAKAAANTYTNTAIANITCPAGQVRQGTSCVVPINSGDINWAVTQAVNTVTCPAGQIRSGSSCVATPSSAPVASSPSGTMCGSATRFAAGHWSSYMNCLGQSIIRWGTQSVWIPPSTNCVWDEGCTTVAGYYSNVGMYVGNCPSGYTFGQGSYAVGDTMYSCFKT
jgi:hypothetical protein